MQEPLFKPNQWILYQQNDAGGFGQITGATFGSEGWSYTIAGAFTSGQLHAVKESEITHLYSDGSWSEASQATGQNSAYTS